MLPTEIRKELISYYKWIVTLAIFILTITISFIALKANDSINNKWAIIASWILLGICIFCNWLLIKRLVTISIIEVSKEKTEIQKIFIESINNLKIYGLLQNICFLGGIVFLLIFFFGNI